MANYLRPKLALLLIHFDDAENDPPLLVHFDVSWEKVKEFFRSEIEKIAFKYV